MKRKKPIIALAQIKYFDLSRKNNVEKIKKYIKKAKKHNADIVCFPESCVHKSEVLYFSHTYINEIREECRKNSIWGIITEDIEINGKNYNSAIVIDRDGSIKGHYKKINLYGDDNIKSGFKVRTFKTDFATIGIVICWDLAYPELFKRLKEAGAEIVFCPSQWQYEARLHEDNKKNREKKILESLILARAFENLFFVAICNPVLKSKYQVSYTAIASPHKIMKHLVGKEGLVIAQLNLNEIKLGESVYS